MNEEDEEDDLPHCADCGTTEEVHEIDGGYICIDCVEELGDDGDMWPDYYDSSGY